MSIDTEQSLGVTVHDPEEVRALSTQHEPPHLVVTGNPITALLQAAIEKGLDPAQLEQVVNLHERMERRQAEKEFNAAMARFHSEMRPIVHNRQKERQAGVKGGAIEYSWADMGQIDSVVTPILSKYGLSYTWGDMKLQDKVVIVPCILTHIGGHSRSAEFPCFWETNAGMSPQQKMMSAQTYAMRGSLSAVLGITTTRDGEPEQKDMTPVDDNQLADLNHMFDELVAGRDASYKARQKERFLKVIGVEKMSEIPAARFKDAVQILDDIRKAIEAKK